MAFKPVLDVKLALCCMRATLPGNWQLLDTDKTWNDFEVGDARAVRTIRHAGKKYWVEVRMSEVDGLAKLVAYGAFANPKPEYYAYFNLYSTDPRHGRPVHAATLGGVGVVTRIGRALRRS